MQRLVLVVLPSPPRSSRLDDQGLALICFAHLALGAVFTTGGHAPGLAF